jgi:phage/plasmid-like protein (TIGR03299 family)
MAHELTTRKNGKVEMAYMGDTPWHGLGQLVTQGASIGVWQKESGMDWEAREAAVHFLPVGPQATDDLATVTSHKVIYRSDNHEPLSVMGSGYEIVQPKQVLEFFRDLTEQGGWHIHTAGTLRGGRKLWAMATNGNKANVVKGDPVENHLLLATSLDGSMKTTAMVTSVRVVCANTLAMALATGGDTVRISHRSVFHSQIIKRALGVARPEFEAFIEQAKKMADTPVALDEALAIIRNVFGITKAPTIDLSWMKLDTVAMQQAEEVQDTRATQRVLELFDGAGRGATLKGVAGTRWGLLNAVTEYVDHEMGRSLDTRLDNAWFGRGNATKQKALELLV